MILIWRTRNAAVLVKDDEIRDIVSTTSIRQLLDNVATPVDPMGVGENEPHFLCRGQKG